MTIHPFCNGLYHPFMVFYPHYIYIYIQSPTELWKKKRFNLQAPPVYDRKVTNMFFFHNYCFHNFFFHNSVGDCMSIDSQFECILRGNIEL